jgi:sugar lactone lactonase YvrE
VAKQVSPKVTIIVILLTLGVVQLVFWLRLVWTPRGNAPGAGGGMGLISGPTIPTGLPEVQVTTLAGDAAPGYKDDKGIMARFNGPSGIAADGEGNLFVSDSRNHRIRRITPDGNVTTIAGGGDAGTMTGGFADGSASAARFWCPSGLAWHPQKGLFIADTGNHRIRLLTPQGEMRTISGGATPRDTNGRPAGGDVDGPAANARFRFPTGLALDGTGNLFVADTGNHSVRKITPDGTVTTIVRLSSVGTQVFVALEDTGSAAPPASSVKAKTIGNQNVATPTSLVVDKTGTLIIADAGNQCLWQVSPSGAASLLVKPPKDDREGADAQHFIRPTGLVSDDAGWVYVTDAAVHGLLRCDSAGNVLLLAGRFWASPMGSYNDGEGSRAGFATPCALARVGNDIFVADFGNHCVRKVSGIDAADPMTSGGRLGETAGGFSDMVRRGRGGRRFAP